MIFCLFVCFLMTVAQQFLSSGLLSKRLLHTLQEQRSLFVLLPHALSCVPKLYPTSLHQLSTMCVSLNDVHNAWNTFLFVLATSVSSSSKRASFRNLLFRFSCLLSFIPTVISPVKLIYFCFQIAIMFFHVLVKHSDICFHFFRLFDELSCRRNLWTAEP